MDRRVRGQLARFEDEGVARGERRGDLPGRLQERIVPGGDQRAHPDGLVDDTAVDARRTGLDHPARLGGGRPPEVAEAVGDVVDVVLALDEPLARVERLGAGERVLVPQEEVGDAQQQVTAVRGRCRGPGALVEGAARGGDRLDGVLAARLVDDADQGAVRRAADLAGALVESAPPCTVNEQVRHGGLPVGRVPQAP